MFRVGFKDENSQVEWKTQGMSHYQRMKWFQIAKCDISPDDVSEFRTIPPGADPADYIKMKIVFYQDKISGERFASFFPFPSVCQPSDVNKPTLPVPLNNIMPERASAPAPTPAPAIANGNYMRRPRRPWLSIDIPPKAPAA